MIDDILNQRQKTHGDFVTNAQISQSIKYLIATSPNAKKLSDVQLEALQMIGHKMARILTGNPNEIDHYQDICGYSQLVVNHLKQN